MCAMNCNSSRHCSSCVYAYPFIDCSFYDLLPMSIASYIVFLHACKLPPKIISSRIIILLGHEPLPVTSTSYGVPLRRSELPPMNSLSHYALLLRSEPPQVISESHTTTPHTLFILRVLFAHCAWTIFYGKH
jgi:hypothetical protein